MQRTRKHNKNFRQTRRKGGVGSNLKKIPPLPASPPPTPPRTPNTKRPQLNVENNNLKPVEPHTYNWYKRREIQQRLEKTGDLPWWKKALGFKKNTPKRVPLNSNGYPIKSYFKPGNSF